MNTFVKIQQINIFFLNIIKTVFPYGLNSRVELSETFDSPSANRAVQTEMNTIRIVSANIVLMVINFRLPQRYKKM